jgi:replicative DNA helicase
MNTPQDTKALEGELIAALIAYPERIDEVAHLLNADLFSSFGARQAWLAIEQLKAAQHPVSPLAVAGKMRAAGATPGGKPPATWISKVMRGVSSSAHLESHLEVLRRAHVVSEAGKLAGQLKAIDPTSERIEAALATVREEIGELELALIEAPPLDLKQILTATMSRVTQNFESGDTLTGIDTGLNELNELTGGFQRGDLHLIGADTGIGKTTLLTHHLLTALKRPGGGRWLLVSPEMTEWQLGLRFLAPLARVDLSRLDRGQLKDQEWARVSNATSKLAAWNAGGRLTFDLSATSTPGRILAAARKLKRQGGLEGIAVDYLQLLSPDKPSKAREEDLNRIGWGLRQVAKELDVAVIALSQVNDVWKRQDKEGNEQGTPRKGNLRGSRTLAHHAALVVLLHRNLELEQAGLSEVIVDKNRHGRCGRFAVTHTLAHCRIQNYEQSF